MNFISSNEHSFRIDQDDQIQVHRQGKLPHDLDQCNLVAKHQLHLNLARTVFVDAVTNNKTAGFLLESEL